MRVFVADPQPTVRHALSVWINGQLGWDVVGESSDSFALLDKLSHLTPEVIIMNGDLPGIPLQELVPKIRQNLKLVAIILLSNSPLEKLESDKLDVDFFTSKIDPPARILDTFLKAESWLKSRSNKMPDGGLMDKTI